MIVYIESNFILEIALEQEQLSAADAILTLAEKNMIKLAFPDFVLSEPFGRIMRERNEQNVLYNSLVNLLSNLQRSKPHKNVMNDMEPIIKVLKDAHFRRLARLHSTFEKLLGIGERANVNAACFTDALIYQQKSGLAPQDSIFYATIVTDLPNRLVNEEKCFLSRDAKAFGRDADHQGIKTELALYYCRYIRSFTQGLDYIQNILHNTK